MQGMAYDNVNRRLYIAQTQNGSDGDDLCVNELTIEGVLAIQAGSNPRLVAQKLQSMLPSVEQPQKDVA